MDVRPDYETAWRRHYAWAARRRREGSAGRARKVPPYLSYRQREVRWAYLLAALLLGVLVFAWRAL